MSDPVDWQSKKTRWTDPSIAEAYDKRRFRSRLQKRKHANDARLVCELLRSVGDRLRVLDAPTGTGRLLADLENCGHRAAGLDLSQEMLRQVARPPEESNPESNSNARLVIGDIERMPFAPSSFDAVVSLRFLFHAHDRQVRIGLMTHFARIAPWFVGHVRSRGNLKHASRKLRSRVGWSARYREAPSAVELQEELSEAGFELTRLLPVSRLFSDKVLFLARRKEGGPISSRGDRDSNSSAI